VLLQESAPPDVQERMSRWQALGDQFGFSLHELVGFFPLFSAIVNRKIQKSPPFSCILLRNEGKPRQAVGFAALVAVRISVTFSKGFFIHKANVGFTPDFSKHKFQEMNVNDRVESWCWG